MLDDSAETGRTRPDADEDQGAPKPPADTRATLLSCMLALMVFYTLYFAAAIIVPVVVAVLFRLLLMPGYRVLTRWHVPQAVAALAMIAAFGAIIGVFGYGLAGPAADWIAKAPQSLPRIEEHLSVLRQPVDRLLNLSHQVEEMAQPHDGGAAPETVVVERTSLAGYLFSGTRSAITGMALTAVFLFFLLLSGDLFTRKLVESLPTFGDKKQAVTMAREIEHNISAYLATITMMNALVGVATGLAMWAIGVPNPPLWGALAFLLNYVMILGPLAGVVIFVGVGLLSFPTLLQALLPAAVYLAIHIVEGEVATPMLVARRFTLNPVLVIFSLVLWDWMWGIPGVLVAVPLLATAKIVCDRVGPLATVGHFLGG